MPSYRIGIDIGGTFTDFSLLEEETGRIRVLKAPSDPSEPEKAVFNGLSRIFSDFQVKAEEVRYFIHGTTLAVNTVIQRSGAKTAFLVTGGFRDILNIGRHRIPDVFNFFTELPRPLVPRALVFEIPERSLATGRIAAPVDRNAVRAAAAQMRKKGVEAVAVCFLHSYRNDENEKVARAILEKEAPGLYISLSSEIWPQMREYERGLVAVMNAHVGQKMKTYFAGLSKGVRALGIDVPDSVDEIERRRHACPRSGRKAGRYFALRPGGGRDRRLVRRRSDRYSQPHYLRHGRHQRRCRRHRGRTALLDREPCRRFSGDHACDRRDLDRVRRRLDRLDR